MSWYWATFLKARVWSRFIRTGMVIWPREETPFEGPPSNDQDATLVPEPSARLQTPGLVTLTTVPDLKNPPPASEHPPRTWRE